MDVSIVISGFVFLEVRYLCLIFSVYLHLQGLLEGK